MSSQTERSRPAIPGWQASRVGARTNLTPVLLGLGLFAIFFAAMALVQFATPDMPDNDGFYHIRLAYIMRTEGLRPEFTWLPLSILNPGEFYDHHFLFHVFLIPFTYGDLRIGAKWASVTFASLAFLCVWLLLRRQRIAFAEVWALGLLVVSEAFLFRMSITRAQSLSLGVLALAVLLLLEKRWRWLGVLAFVYVWLYDAFPLIVILAGVYTAAEWFITRRLDWRPLLAAVVGVGLGMLINPYFPDNIIFAVRHILPKLIEATSTSVGNEWYPYDTGQLLKNSPLALAAFVAGALGLGLSGRRMDTRTLFTFLLAVLFGLMLFQARRFVEYFPAFTLLFAAVAWHPILASLAEPAPASGWRARRPLLVNLAGLVLLAPAAFFTLRQAQDSLRSSHPYSLYASASAWLVAHTPPGSLVFQTDWDDFPRLFFYNTHNTYLAGLDPTYFQLYDPELYAEWLQITRGEVSDLSSIIPERFGSRFIISDLNHGDFIDQAEADSGLKEVYRDQQAVIFEVAD